MITSSSSSSSNSSKSKIMYHPLLITIAIIQLVSSVSCEYSSSSGSDQNPFINPFNHESSNSRLFTQLERAFGRPNFWNFGLVAMGATALQPLMGSVGSGRKKREVNGLIDKAGQAILYARNLYDILANLDDAFLKYDITSNACQLKAICEVHNVGRNSGYKDFGDQIIDLIRMEKEVEENEMIPLAKVLFKVYADAANHGRSHYDCSTLYPSCQKDIISFIRDKQERQQHLQKQKPKTRG